MNDIHQSYLQNEKKLKDLEIIVGCPVDEIVNNPYTFPGEVLLELINLLETKKKLLDEISVTYINNIIDINKYKKRK